MKIYTVLCYLVIMCKLCVIQVCCFFDPLTWTGVSIGVGVLYQIFSKNEVNNVIKDNLNQAVKYVGQKIGYYEGCEDYWIPSNIDALDVDLRSNVFGQPLAVEIIISALRHHLKRHSNPGRALVLSFHGSPGTGKNFVSQMILKNMFRKGDKTEYVKFFRSAIDFPSVSNTDKYKQTIIDTVKNAVYECHRSVFVFDEIEKMPRGILDVISGFVRLKYSGHYDFRRVIFILISNIGSEQLVRSTLKNFQEGRQREEMKMRDLSELLAKESFNAEGGLHNTGLVKSQDISFYVPFLPLEREHVILCLEKEVSKMGQIMSEELVEQVLEELTFQPEDKPVFASGGCKKVGEVASWLIEREVLRKRRKKT